LAAWVGLVERVQRGGIVSLPFTNDVINTVHPDFDEIRRYVAESLQTPAATVTPTPKPTSSPSTTPTATPKPSAT
jgi:hypothetical protein